MPSKDTHSLYTVRTRHGIGIRAVPNDADDPWDFLERQIGSDNLEDAYEATEEDLSYVRTMGGRIPKLS